MLNSYLKKGCDFTLVLVSIYSFVCVCLFLIFDIDTVFYNTLIVINSFASALFFSQELIRIYLYKDFKLYLKERLFEIILILIVILTYFYQDYLLSFFRLYFPSIHLSKIVILYLGIIQTGVFLFQSIRFLRSSKVVSRISLSSAQLFVLSFLAPIGIGGLLFKLPRLTENPISWVDSYFLSFSAFCVTGLSSISIENDLSWLGKIFLVVAVQMGALGIVALSLSVGHIFSGGLGLKEKLVLTEILSEEKIGETTKLLMRIFSYTLIIEIIGAIVLYFTKYGHSSKFSFIHVFESIFYAVVSFGNAGFSLSDAGLVRDFDQGSYSYLSAIMLLCFLGSLGFPVIINLYNKCSSRNSLIKVSNKIILYSHVGFFFVGLLGFYFLHFSDQTALFFSDSNLKAIFHSAFLSVSSRTSGFHIYPTESLTLLTCLWCCFLMWVGGSPNSAAGGIKNITFVTAAASAWATLRGEKTILFERYISPESSQKAFSIMFFSLIVIVVSIVFMIYLEPELSRQDIVFEVFSAFGTTGLSRGITASLTDTSKIILMINMIVGRVGIINVVSMFVIKNKKVKLNYLKENLPIQ